MVVVSLPGRVRRVAIAVLAVSLLAVPTAHPASADPGDLDTAFGDRGRVELAAGRLRLDTSGVDVLRQSDGRLVLVHSSNSLSAPAVILTRHLRDGRLDRTFGEGGRVVVPTAPFAPLPLAAMLQDDRIVVVGAVANILIGFFDARPLVMRFTPDGRQDRTFGRNGRVILDLGGTAFNTSVAPAPAGGLFVAGSTQTDAYVVRLDDSGRRVQSYGNAGIRRLPTGHTSAGAVQPVVSPAGRGQVHLAYGARVGDESVTRVVRLGSAGGVRPGFGSSTGVELDATTGDETARALLRQGPRLLVLSAVVGGIVITALDPATGAVDVDWGASGRRQFTVATLEGSIAGARLDDRGRIVLVGWAPAGDDRSVWIVARLRPGGAPDTSFGGDGQVDVTLPGMLGPRSLALVGTGYALAGSVWTHGGIVRMSPTGALVESFGRDGVAVPRVVVDGAQARAVMVESTGRTIVSGNAYRTSSVSSAVLWRLDRRGRPDESFGRNGSVTIAVRGRTTGVDSIVRLADGRYVLGMRMSDENRSWLMVARLLPDGRPDRSFGTEGRRVVGASTIEPEAGLVQLRVDAAGRYVVGTTSSTGIHLARLRVDGRPDTTFGSGGILTITPSVGKTASLGSFRVLGDGRLAIVDLAGLRVLRRNADGSPTLGFGPDGAQPLLVAPAFTQGVADVRPSGAVVMSALDFADSSLVVTRTGPTGLPDETFGTGGLLRHPATGDRRRQPTAIAVRPDGTILLTAAASVGGFNPMTAQGEVVRITPTGELDTSFADDGVARVDLGGSKPDVLIGLAVSGDRAVVVGGVFGASPTVHVARVVL